MEYDPPVTETKVKDYHTQGERERETGREGYGEGSHALLSAHPTRELLTQ